MKFVYLCSKNIRVCFQLIYPGITKNILYSCCFKSFTCVKLAKTILKQPFQYHIHGTAHVKKGRHILVLR